MPDAIGHVAFGPTSFHFNGRRKKKLREKINSPAAPTAPINPAQKSSETPTAAPPPEAVVEKEPSPTAAKEETPTAPTPPNPIPAKSGSTSVFAKGKAGFMKQVKEEVKKIQEETPKGTIDAEKLPQIWSKLQVEAQKNEDLHLLSLLQRGEPELVGDHELLIPYFNALERETLAERKEWIAESLRGICGVYPLLTLVEKEDSEAKKENLLYTPKEKLEYLLEQNPMVSDLLQKFNLNVDY